MNYACFIFGGRQGIIMNSIETTAESNEEICVARARGRLQYKMEVVEGWQTKKYPHCRKLCSLLCASPLQSSISSHGPEQTWRRLWLTRRSLGLTWGCPLLMYVCMYVCMYLAAQASHKSVPGSIFVYAQAPSHGRHIPA